MGWQRQDNGLGVQEVVEQAVKAFSGETVTVYCAGRTDAGVHALGQVAHMDLSGEWGAIRVRDAMNAHLRPHAVVVLDADIVETNFHARFSAIERVYEYRILDRPAPPTVTHGAVWWVPKPLNTDVMTDAADKLLGRHDFSTFRGTGCQAKSPIKSLDELSVTREGEGIVITARARSFLYHQVRNMVGTLARVGVGRWSLDEVSIAFAKCDRRAGGPTAPASGLFLLRVGY